MNFRVLFECVVLSKNIEHNTISKRMVFCFKAIPTTRRATGGFDWKRYFTDNIAVFSLMKFSKRLTLQCFH